MTSNTEISPGQLARLIGTPQAPRIVDVRPPDEAPDVDVTVPTAERRDAADVARWAPRLASRRTVVVGRHGGGRAQGVAAWLRAAGIEAETLEGGHERWVAEGHLLVRGAGRCPRDGDGRSLWVTRARPKIDRVACPWLIRRFVDPSAVFLFVAPPEVAEVAEAFGAAPFDVEGVFWSHRGERCTFDIMLEEFGLDRHAPLTRVAEIVRAADTGRPDLAPQAAGLLAISLGLSRMHRDDLDQVEAGLAVYDALYRWARDAAEETHNWPGPEKRA